MPRLARPKNDNSLPPFLTPDYDRGGFVLRNPLNGKRKRFGPDERDAAIDMAKRLGEYVENERKQQMLDSGRPTIAGLVRRWIDYKLELMPWDDGTKAARLAKMRRIERELGDKIIERVDCMFLEEWLGFCRTADQFNDWRFVFVLLWRFAVSKKLAATNEPEKIEVRSTSKKIEANRKQRLGLDVDGFAAIHAGAPQYLQIAMELSLVTLQARLEVCNMQHSHFRGGHLYVIRDKVSGDSDMAFIKIVLTDELLELQARARSTVETPKRAKREAMPVLSPYLVHRHPEHKRRQWLDNKPHWTYVEPEYLSKAFAAARDSIERFAQMQPAQRPSFHEIRGLGARLYEDAGMPQASITALMTHADKRTTEIYLDGGAKALSDADYRTVTAPMRVADVLGRR